MEESKENSTSHFRLESPKGKDRRLAKAEKPINVQNEKKARSEFKSVKYLSDVHVSNFSAFGMTFVDLRNLPSSGRKRFYDTLDQFALLFDRDLQCNSSYNTRRWIKKLREDGTSEADIEAQIQLLNQNSKDRPQYKRLLGEGVINLVGFSGQTPNIGVHIMKTKTISRTASVHVIEAAPVMFPPDAIDGFGVGTLNTLYSGIKWLLNNDLVLEDTNVIRVQTVDLSMESKVIAANQINKTINDSLTTRALADSTVAIETRIDVIGNEYSAFTRV